MSLQSPRQLSESLSAQRSDSMEVSSERKQKRKQSPVIDLSPRDSPAPVVWDPDNDLGNTMHRNKRYLSEVVANDLSRRMNLDSTACLNQQSTSSSVSPPLPTQPPTSPRSMFRSMLRSPSVEDYRPFRSPTPDAVSSDSMDASALEHGPNDATTTSYATQPRTTPTLHAPEPVHTAFSGALPGRPSRPGELPISRSTPIMYRPIGVRESSAGPSGPASSSGALEFSPGSPSDLRFSLDLRKTALLRSLLSRAEDASNLMVTDDSAVRSQPLPTSGLTRSCKSHEAPPSMLKPKRTSSGTLIDLPLVVTGALGLGHGASTAKLPSQSQPPSQGFSRMGFMHQQPSGLHESPNSASMDTTSSSSSSADHRLGMPPGSTHELSSTAVSNAMFPGDPSSTRPMLSCTGPVHPTESPYSQPASNNGISWHTAESELNSWHEAQVRARAMVQSSMKLDGTEVGLADMQLVGMALPTPPVPGISPAGFAAPQGHVHRRMCQ